MSAEATKLYHRLKNDLESLQHRMKVQTEEIEIIKRGLEEDKVREHEFIDMLKALLPLTDNDTQNTESTL